LLSNGKESLIHPNVGAVESVFHSLLGLEANETEAFCRSPIVVDHLNKRNSSELRKQLLDISFLDLAGDPPHENLKILSFHVIDL
jgi:hypothetical protein